MFFCFANTLYARPPAVCRSLRQTYAAVEAFTAE